MTGLLNHALLFIASDIYEEPSLSGIHFQGYALHQSAWPPRNDSETGPIKRSSIRKMHQHEFGTN